jgi:pyruvoyl-dependent arginine decarboxylase (PvlArgDC)
MPATYSFVVDDIVDVAARNAAKSDGLTLTSAARLALINDLRQRGYLGHAHAEQLRADEHAAELARRDAAGENRQSGGRVRARP